MKTTLSFTLTLLTFVTLAFVPNSFAQDTAPEYVVRAVYFVPKDREPDPNMDTKLDTMIKDVQKFYADEMERHGFGRKTFRFEADGNGNVKVHQVTGKYNDADYINKNRWAFEEIEDRFNLWPPRNKNIYFIVYDYSSETVEGDGGSACGAATGSSSGGHASVPASGPCFNFEIIVHEFGHTFGLPHDFRSNAFMMSYGRYRNQLSQCAAEWLDVHRYFNPNQEVFNLSPNRHTNFQMLPSTFVSPPVTIRLRFELTDPDGLHQAQLRLLTRGEFSVIACQRLSGQSDIAEFDTNDLLGVGVIELHVMDAQGDFQSSRFTIDISDLVPASKGISIPDPSFAAAIRWSLRFEPDEPITELDMIRLLVVAAGYNPERPPITDITGIEYVKNGKVFGFFDNQISDLTIFASASFPELRTLWLGRNQISDITPLAGLTQVLDLRLSENQISDITPLAGLTQLQVLELSLNPINDYTPLMALTQLSEFYLAGNQISDVSQFAELKNLKRLDLGGNQISDIRPLAKLVNLEKLHIIKNQISDIGSLAELKNLEELWIGSNQISDLNPLAELKNLRELYLLGNEISDVSPLAGLTKLKVLYLDNNQISDVSPLAELVNLNRLYLTENPIRNKKPLLDLLRKNPDMKIYLKVWDKPLPVTLSHFRAEHTDAGVLLKWTTESEVDNAGFYIYRSKTKNGEFKVVNPTMIQGAGTTGERQNYTWTDTTVKPNTVYYYRIEDVSHAGVREQLATVRLRGLVSARGKLTTRWVDLKSISVGAIYK